MARKKKRKKRVVYKLICGYCKYYKECEVEFNTGACEEFEMVDIFHCNKLGQRIYVDVCIARIKKSKGGNCSKSCTQGKLVGKIKGMIDE